MVISGNNNNNNSDSNKNTFLEVRKKLTEYTRGLQIICIFRVLCESLGK